MLNPYASPVVQGIAPYSVQAPGFLDISYGYPYNVTLTASQLLSGQQVAIGSTAGFVLRGLLFISTGSFNLRVYDGDQYAISPGMIRSGNLQGQPGDPFPFFPEVWYPAGGRILLDIVDTSVGTNVVQILFIGANRYKL